LSSKPIEYKTVAEVMAENLQKISESLRVLTTLPMPRELILLYVAKKTRLPRRDIEAVFAAVDELNKKTNVPRTA
jgi:hypothetical protein